MLRHHNSDIEAYRFIERNLQGCTFFLTVHLLIPTGDAQKVQSMRKAEKVATKLEMGSLHHPALRFVMC